MWIEIQYLHILQICVLVTLYTRVWIEILAHCIKYLLYMVTLYTRVWIEISDYKTRNPEYPSHPLHEGVD